MQRISATLLSFGLCFVLFAGIAAAGEMLDITYRHEGITADDSTVSGVLVLYVVNSSGAEIRDIMISVPEENNVTFDNRAIPIGTLAGGQPVQVLSEFTVPAEIANLDAIEETSTWKIDYTGADGRRAEASAPGMLVR